MLMGSATQLLTINNQPITVSEQTEIKGQTHLLGSGCSSGKSFSTGCSSNWWRDAFWWKKESQFWLILCCCRWIKIQKLFASQKCTKKGFVHWNNREKATGWTDVLKISKINYIISSFSTINRRLIFCFLNTVTIPSIGMTTLTHIKCFWVQITHTQKCTVEFHSFIGTLH